MIIKLALTDEEAGFIAAFSKIFGTGTTSGSRTISTLLATHPLFHQWAGQVAKCGHCAGWITCEESPRRVSDHRIKNPDIMTVNGPVRPYWIACPGSQSEGSRCRPTAPIIVAYGAHMKHLLDMNIRDHF